MCRTDYEGWVGPYLTCIVVVVHSTTTTTIRGLKGVAEGEGEVNYHGSMKKRLVGPIWNGILYL